MADDKKVDGVKKKSEAMPVVAPLISMNSDSLLAAATQKEVIAPKKEEPPKVEVKISQGPTLEDLALLQTPTVEEELTAKNKEKTAAELKGEVKKPADATKKSDVIEAAPVVPNLETIAAQQRVTQQQKVRTDSEYRMGIQLAPHNTYQPDSLKPNPELGYRMNEAKAPYTANIQNSNATQRGEVVTQYERADLQRAVGRETAEEMLDEKRRQIHGDKGVFSTYDKRRN